MITLAAEMGTNPNFTTKSKFLPFLTVSVIKMYSIKSLKQLNIAYHRYICILDQA